MGLRSLSVTPTPPIEWRSVSQAVERWAAWALAVLGPMLATVALAGLGGQQQRDYVFVYLGLVAIVGVLRGLWPALLAAAISFLLVDFFFVQPLYTFTIADEQDIVNLLAFMGVAGVVGLLASRRRTALLDAEALTAQLREANSELVRLNKEQARAAQAALTLARTEQQIRTLQETDRLRRELLANVSHELRTPLGTILAESTDTDGLRTTAQARERMNTIASEARRLNTLVEDILDMARIEGGSLELDFEPILLSDAISAAADRLHLTSPERKVEWNQDETGREVLADWDRLGQIFDNLLANADRFGPPGSAIRVEVSSEEPNLVTVRVADRGPGVPPELRDHVFDRFVRGDPGAEQKAGTGLGLAIVKGLVEAHAGTVSLEPAAAGSGAVFRFTLPEAPGPP